MSDHWYDDWPHLVNYFEIPSDDFDRAVRFYGALYQTALQTNDEPTAMGDPIRRGFLPRQKGAIGGAVVHFKEQRPARGGVLIYLHAGVDLQPMLDRVEPAGGKVIVPKSKVSDDIGFFAIFLDTEGNEIALHSPR
jgi:uncharacterized protein